MINQTRRQFLTTTSLAFGAMAFGLSACGEESGGNRTEISGDAPQAAQNAGENGGKNIGTAYGDVVLGDPDAPVEIIEYASLTCPHCANFHAVIYPEIKEKYIDTGKVRFIFRNFVLNQVDLSASMVVRCGGEDRFYGLTELVYSRQQELVGQDPIAALSSIVRRAGMSRADVEACLQDTELQKAIITARNEGSDKYTVNATPTFIINGKDTIVGAQSFDQFASAIDKYL